MQVQQSATYSLFGSSFRDLTQNARGETSISRRRAEHGAESGEWCAANKKTPGMHQCAQGDIMPSVANKRLLQICIFHSEVITLCDGLYKWLFKAHFTHNALRSLFKHGDWDSIVKNICTNQICVRFARSTREHQKYMCG